MPSLVTTTPLGATRRADGSVRFLLWAPRSPFAALCLLDPEPRELEMRAIGQGYYFAEVPDLPTGARYRYRVESGTWPDPASRLQPEGVHGPSAVVDPAFAWTDDSWRGLPMAEHVLYEFHVGTLTPEGTFDAAIGRLDRLVELGVTAVEVMPVAQFPGTRNWGYDGVYPFAVQPNYGGIAGFQRFIDAAHARGLAVYLDVVYNHLGPEGNYTSQYGPYFTSNHPTPWGQSVNYDGPDGHGVRRFVLENVKQWQVDFRLDGLRLDAVDWVVDDSEPHVLAEAAAECQERSRQTGRPFRLIAEASGNNPRLCRAQEAGGLGLDGCWSFDFHHCLQALLTGERHGYFMDYERPAQFAHILQHGFHFTGQHSKYRGRYGGVPHDWPGEAFVAYSQSHDEVGNRAKADRLCHQVDWERAKLAAVAVLTAPFTPMLFMGEEYAEPAPFHYFVSHSDPDLVEAVRRGRKAEYAAFAVGQEFEDPQDARTLERSRLSWVKAGHGRNLILWNFYRELLRLRRTHPALSVPDRSRAEAGGGEPGRAVWLRRWAGPREVLVGLNLCESPVLLPLPAGEWGVLLDADDDLWRGRGALAGPIAGGRDVTLRPWAAVVLER